MVSGGPLWCNGVWISGLSGNKNGRTTDGRPFSGVFLSLDYFTNTLDALSALTTDEDAVRGVLNFYALQVEVFNGCVAVVDRYVLNAVHR